MSILPYWKSTGNFLVILLAVTLLTGCNYELPQSDAGYVQYYRQTKDDSRAARRELTAGQIEALTRWFSTRRTGWEFRIQDVAFDLSIGFTRDGRLVGGVNLTESQMCSGDKFRTLLAGERAEIQAILDAT